MYTPDDQRIVPLLVPYDTDGYDVPPLPYMPYAHYIERVPMLSETTFAPTPSTIVQAIPSLPVQEQPSPVRPKRRRRWILPALAALLLLIIGGSMFPLVSYLNRSTPEKTLKTFCTALEKETYQLAYDQLTTNLQAQLTETDFAKSLAADKIIQCTYGSTSEAAAMTKTSLKLVHMQQHFVNNDIVTLTKQPDSIWRISDLAVAS